MWYGFKKVVDICKVILTYILFVTSAEDKVERTIGVTLKVMTSNQWIIDEFNMMK